jgi:hypothetical protein
VCAADAARSRSGINRLTANFALALPALDDAFRVSDAEAVAMARFLVAHDGLFLGSSSACNLVACVKLVRKRGWVGTGRRVVTILYVTAASRGGARLMRRRCDSGARHYSKVRMPAICHAPRTTLSTYYAVVLERRLPSRRGYPDRAAHNRGLTLGARADGRQRVMYRNLLLSDS